MTGPTPATQLPPELVARGARPLGGAAILAALIWRLGTGPFLDGIRMIDGWSLLAAGRHRGAHDGLLCLAVAPGRARSAGGRAAAHRDRRRTTGRSS